MGLRPDQARSSLRFSLGKQTTSADIDFALSMIPETVARLRELSPVWQKRQPAVAAGSRKPDCCGGIIETAALFAIEPPPARLQFFAGC